MPTPEVPNLNKRPTLLGRDTFAEKADRFIADTEIRERGYRISARPRVGPVIWEKGYGSDRVFFEQDDVLKRIRMEKRPLPPPKKKDEK